MSEGQRAARVIAGISLLCLVLAACQGQTGGAAQPSDVLDKAAAEATAIVQQAQATALMLQAQAQATAVMAEVDAANHTPTPAPTLVARVARKDQATASPTPRPTPESEAQPVSQEQTVEVARVAFAAEGGMIHIQFRAPPEVAAKWWPGSVSVTDEATDRTYNEIPVMPRIGPLIGRPKRAGQLGYVMLVHAPPELQPGARVTVVLGEYRFEHVPVQ